MGTTQTPPNPADQTKELVQQQGRQATVKDLLTSKQFHDQVAMALPRHMKPERFIRVALNATMRQPELLQCQRESLFLALLQLSSYGIEADGRRAHLIPFTEHKTCVCGHPMDYHKQGQCQTRGCTCNTARKRKIVNLIIDYKGLAELVRRSGDVSYIHADVVLKGDEWDFQFGSEAFLRHKPNLELGTWKERAIIAVYSFVKLKDGTEDFIVLSRADVEAIRATSKMPNSAPWQEHYPEMAKKSAFRRHSKWLPLSPELRDAIEADDEGEDFSNSASIVLEGLNHVPTEEEELESSETLADRVKQAAGKQTEEQQSGQAQESADKPEPETKVTKKQPPKRLYDFIDWETARASNDMGKDFLKVAGSIYEKVDGEGLDSRYEGWKG